MRGQSAVKFIAVLLVIAVLAGVAMYGVDFLWGFKIPSAKEAIRLGLDLKGGATITYEADTSAGVTKDQIDTAKEILRRRLDNLSYFDAEVTADLNNNRLLVNIPSVEDPEKAVKELGQTARLTFRDPDGKIVVDGSDIAEAKYAFGPVDQTGNSVHHISLEMTSEGAKKFADVTTRLAPNQEILGIYLDEALQVAPSVNTPITDGKAIITGNYTRETASSTAALIRSGALPFSLKVIEMQAVGPTLGQKALNVSMNAGAIAILLVMGFMVVYYRLPGIIASIALTGYVVLVTIILGMFRITLTLPGIAGVILSVGMAVDANVIIFERIKEELRLGKTLRAAIDAGFRRAFTAIFDSNITTIIAGVVLMWLGSGPIQGFARVLVIGVLTSMFTAITLTQFLLKQFVDLNIAKNPGLYGVAAKEGAK